MVSWKNNQLFENFEYALCEFEKYRVKQEQLYQSDFDKVLIGYGQDEIIVIGNGVNSNTRFVVGDK